MEDTQATFDDLHSKMIDAGFQFEKEQKPHHQNRDKELKYVHPVLINKLRKNGASARGLKFYIKPLSDNKDSEVGLVNGISSSLQSEEFFINANRIDTHNNSPAWVNSRNDNSLDQLLLQIKNYVLNEKLDDKENQNSNAKPKEKRISRLAFNSNGWVMPSGPYGKSRHKDSHEAKYGYGHEEWLFDTSKLVDGYHYGFLEPIRKQQNAYVERVFDVWLYTIDNVSKTRYWIGEIFDLEVITKDEANSIKAKYQTNDWLKEMEDQIIESGANYKGFSAWEGVDLFNVRFKPKNIIVNDPYVELVPSHPIVGLSRYTFAHYRDKFFTKLGNENKEAFVFYPDEKDVADDEDSGVQSSRHKIEPKIIEIKYLHKEISKQLSKELKRVHGAPNVKAEHPSCIGANKIDIVVNSESEGLIFYEIKTYNSVKSSIREAIGQLFEYSFWPSTDKAKQLIVLTQKHENIEDVKSYFKHLREKLKISIYYQWFDLETNELSEKF